MTIVESTSNPAAAWNWYAVKDSDGNVLFEGDHRACEAYVDTH